VQDLVGERTTDSAKGPGVGERPFESMTPLKKRSAKRFQRGIEDLDATGIERPEPCGAAHQVQRHATLGAGLGQQQRPGREVKRRQTSLARDLPLRLRPPEPTRHHQMKHHEQIGVETDHESFADPINLADPVFHERVERRVERLEQRERSQTYFIQRRANDPWLERTQIGDDLGKLRHDGAL
jgi:hypothetical protein